MSAVQSFFVYIYMPKTRERKKASIEDLKEAMAQQKAVVFVDFQGVDSKALFKLRDDLKKENCRLTVVKKTLLKKSLESLGEKELAGKIDEVEGQLALVFGFQDEITPAKICYNFSTENENLKILAGLSEKEFLAKEKVVELANLPSREELLSRLVYSLIAPVSQLVNVLKGNIKGLVYVLARAKT